MSAVLKFDKARWQGATVVCIASGPSLTAEDVELVRSQHAAGLCKVIVVNREFMMAPWADVCYMADYRCWNEYNQKFKETFKGEAWTIDRQAARQFKLNLIGRNFADGFCKQPGYINTGSNSGFQVIHLAATWGASRIVLLGYDMQRTGGKEHHYGKHNGRLPNGNGFAIWLAKMKPLLGDLRKHGVIVMNASRVTAIPEDWAKRTHLESVLWQ